jgi:G6PDH family F420-dependent oxidoreductase
MPEYGYKLSSEDYTAQELVRQAQRAEQLGFTIAMISDHYHPWIDEQGHSPFVWSVLGAIAQATETLTVGTAVTCPTVRTHPAIIAQAAATTATLLPGRFVFGVGSGEALNEHILGDRWPPAPIRIEMMEEAIDVIRLLWEGGVKDHRGRHYMVENARLYDLPDELPPILVAAAGDIAATAAARKGEGLITTSPDKEVIQAYKDAGGDSNQIWGELSLSWAETAEEAVKAAHRRWPNTALKGQLSQDLPTPTHFEQAVQLVTEEDIRKAVPCGPDPQPVIDKVQEYIEAGFTHIWFNQLAKDADGFFRFMEDEVMSQLPS